MFSYRDDHDVTSFQRNVSDCFKQNDSDNEQDKIGSTVVCGYFLKKYVVKKSNTYFKILRKNICFVYFLCYICVIKYNIRGRVYVFDKEEIESGRSWRGEIK